MSTRQFKPIKTIGTKITLSRQKPRFTLSRQKPKTRFTLSKPKPKITGFKISGHGEFVDDELFEEGFQEYKYNLKTFIVRVRGNFGESVLTRECSTNFEENCIGGTCSLGDAANYVNFLQIVCGTDKEGSVGLFRALPYINGDICNEFANGNDTDYDITSLIPNLQLSSDDENGFYYGYLIYYDGDNGRTNKKRNFHRFNNFNNFQKDEEKFTYLSSEIINFYNLVKDSDIQTFTVDVSACLVIDEELQIFCKSISDGKNNIKYEKWFTCFHNFTFAKDCSSSDSVNSSDSDTELSAGKGKKKKTIKKKVKKKKVKKKKVKKKKVKKKKVKKKKVKKKKTKRKKPKKKKP
jgi:hypothetical protein